MGKIRTFFQRFSFLLPFRPEPKNHCWAILFNGGCVGIYVGQDFSHLYIERWTESFPGDPDPIMLVEYFEIY